MARGGLRGERQTELVGRRRWGGAQQGDQVEEWEWVRCKDWVDECGRGIGWSKERVIPPTGRSPIAAIACWSSSSSACTVPNRRQASALEGCALTSASKAKAASVNRPRLKLGGWVGRREGDGGWVSGRVGEEFEQINAGEQGPMQR